MEVALAGHGFRRKAFEAARRAVVQPPTPDGDDDVSLDTVDIAMPQNPV